MQFHGSMRKAWNDLMVIQKRAAAEALIQRDASIRADVANQRNVKEK